jgi:hypothetical protein
VVEVTTRYSNPVKVLKFRTLLVSAPVACPTAPVRTRQVQNRLHSDDITCLVADYQAGVTISELASHYLIHRTTVIEHVKRSGVKMRYRKRRRH